ncbi:MAG: sigma-70 family RNA polymerase sigma factor [Planctomycetota bacterium]
MSDEGPPFGTDHSVTSLTLLKRLRADPKDAEAWNRFIRIYGSRIDAWCRRWKLQEADVQDVTQNILLKLAKQFGRFEYDPRRSFRSWLKTVTESALRDFAMARGKQTALTSVQEVLDTKEARSDLLTRLAESYDLEILAVARDRVESLVDPVHWGVFRMMADEELSGAEAAIKSGVSVANAFAIKSRVQKLIRHEVQLLGNGEDELET